ncbi:MAG: acyltransferase family protein [Eubacterium sp.]|nr:acyltransferase family protein [Eubacterium sp.]
MDGKTNPERNYSIDLLRIISMLLVICCHIYSHGGYKERFIFPDFMWIYTRFFVALACVAVNVFILISGYLTCQSEKFHVSRIVRIYTSSVFISEVCYFIYLLHSHTNFSIVDFIQNLFFGNMWFISQYIALYLFAPFLNKLINSINKKQHLFIILLIYLIGGFTRDLCRYTWVTFSDGYSFMWFIELYFVGAFIRKYADAYSPRISTCVYLICGILLTASSILFEVNNLPVISDIYPENHFYRYNSIFVLVSAVALFIAFVNMKRKPPVRLIKFITPAVLGVYILHDNIYMREMLWNSAIYRKITDSVSGASHIFLMPVIVITIFAVCVLIEKIRLLFSDFIYKNKMISGLLLKLDCKYNELIK